MASFNKVIIAGNLTRDVELRYTPSGTPVTDIGLAVNDRRKGQNGEYIDEVSFIDVTLWSRTAEIADEYLSKGSNVMIEGRLKQESWEKDGQKHYKIKVICERLVMLGKKSDSDGSSRRQSQPASAAEANYSDDYSDNEIPF
jgi:single-strand DNA-binding protein